MSCLADCLSSIKMNLFVIVISVAYISFVNCSSECNNFGTCGECIGYAREKCVWCAQEEVTTARCQPESFVNSEKKTWCSKGFLYNPDPKTDTIKDEPFNVDYNGVKVQFKPQIIKIKARPGVPVNFRMSYKPAQHFPLDVYYLMDNSYTMITHKAELQKQANVIYEELTKLTNNVILGVGSFVEKPGFPYVQIGIDSYAFKNHLSLTHEVEKFQNIFKNIPFGSNWDDPEAALDALMQVMVCENRIGWRNASRRIIVLCTDSTYHSAGDGKMIGIIKPNDMTCHLDKDEDLYQLTSLDQDYPSVSQINKVAADGKFTVIFAAVNNVRDEYTFLSKQVLGAKYAELKSKSNIVEIIKESYLKSVRSLTLDYDFPEFVELTLDPNCKTPANGICESTHTDPTVEINATVLITECPPKNQLYEFNIGPVGLKDKLTVILDVDCTCECEKKMLDTPSPKCSNAGFLQCGICACNNASYGSECQCNQISPTSMTVDLDKCKLDVHDANLCSGKGTCVCGKCQCKTGYSGNHCEFDDESCPRSEVSGLCGGKGKCQYGKCNCNKDWTGDDCTCTKSKQQCIAQYSKEVCSGNGVCECGICVCNTIEGKNESYSGMFCDYCEGCAGKYCKELEKYVFCNYNEDKVSCDKQFNDTTSTEVRIVPKTEMIPANWPMSTWCKKKLDGGTAILFLYYHNATTRQLNVVIQKEYDTSARDKTWIAVGSAIGAVLLIGLLTVIGWKVLMDLHDAREFKKFEEKALAEGFDVSLNPLYNEPNISFSNPAYQNAI